MSNNCLETFKGKGSDNGLLKRSEFTITKISEGKYLVYGGNGNNRRNRNSMMLIEVEDVLLPAFHLVEATGMLEF